MFKSRFGTGAINKAIYPNGKRRERESFLPEERVWSLIGDQKRTLIGRRASKPFPTHTHTHILNCAFLKSCVRSNVLQAFVFFPERDVANVLELNQHLSTFHPGINIIQ